MRRWLFVLLILLLPLRGWVGDAMAMPMPMALPGQYHALASGATLHADGDSGLTPIYGNPDASSAADDCGAHSAAQDTGDESDAVHPEACAMCQTCHTVAVLQPADFSAVVQVNSMSPAAAMQFVVSAELALPLKPPIS